jgi:hypothetical protein
VASLELHAWMQSAWSAMYIARQSHHVQQQDTAAAHTLIAGVKQCRFQLYTGPQPSLPTELALWCSSRTRGRSGRRRKREREHVALAVAAHDDAGRRIRRQCNNVGAAAPLEGGRCARQQGGLRPAC